VRACVRVSEYAICVVVPYLSDLVYIVSVMLPLRRMRRAAGHR